MLKKKSKKRIFHLLLTSGLTPAAAQMVTIRSSFLELCDLLSHWHISLWFFPLSLGALRQVEGFGNCGTFWGFCLKRIMKFWKGSIRNLLNTWHNDLFKVYSHSCLHTQSFRNLPFPIMLWPKVVKPIYFFFFRVFPKKFEAQLFSNQIQKVHLCAYNQISPHF